MKSKVLVDISSRPQSMTIERQMKADAASIYQAFSENWDLWFAQPGECMMKPQIDSPYFFKTKTEWGGHPHHGRFVELEPNKLVVMTWVTGKGGTDGAETVIRVELTPNKEGTMMRFTHSGFETQESCQGHIDNWPEAFDGLEEALANQKK